MTKQFFSILRTACHLLFLSILPFATPPVAAQNTTVQTVLAELPSANKKLREAFKSYRGTGVVTDVANYDGMPEQAKESLRKRGKEVKTGLRVLSTKRLDFSVDGSNRKVVVEVVDAAVDQNAVAKKEGAKPLRKTELRLGDHGSSWLEWRGDDRDPVIKSVGKEAGPESVILNNEFESFLKCVHSLPMGTLSDLLANPDFKITGVKDVPGPNGSFVEAQFEYQSARRFPPPKKGAAPVKDRSVGAITLDPARGWAIQKYEYHDPQNATLSESATVEYDANQKICRFH